MKVQVKRLPEVFVTKLAESSAGLTFAVKDNIDVMGARSGMGCAAFKDISEAAHTASVVQGLIDSDLQLIGKLAMHELAFGMTGINHYSGTPINTLYPDLIPGGSSSGCAAAVASGDVNISIGTDTGGSIRLPAACCGVVGFKPTYGRLSREGVSPKTSSLDCVGPFARNVTLIEKAMQAMDDTFIPSHQPQTITLGVLDVDCEPSIQTEFEAVMQRISALSNVRINKVSLTSMNEAFNAGMIFIASEAYAEFGNLPQEQLGSDIATRLQAASEISADQIQSARNTQRAFQDEVTKVLLSVDAIILPTLPSKPLELEEAKRGATDLASSALVRPFNVSGHPAISLPVASADPFSVQLVGALNEDEKLCAIAKQLENQLPKPVYPN